MAGHYICWGHFQSRQPEFLPFLPFISRYSYKRKQVYCFYMYLLCKLYDVGYVSPFLHESNIPVAADISWVWTQGFPTGEVGEGDTSLQISGAGGLITLFFFCPRRSVLPHCSTWGNAGKGKLSLFASPTSSKKTLLEEISMGHALHMWCKVHWIAQ